MYVHLSIFHTQDVDIEEEGPRDQEPPSEFYLPPVLKVNALAWFLCSPCIFRDPRDFEETSLTNFEVEISDQEDAERCWRSKTSHLLALLLILATALASRLHILPIRGLCLDPHTIVIIMHMSMLAFPPPYRSSLATWGPCCSRLSNWTGSLRFVAQNNTDLKQGAHFKVHLTHQLTASPDAATEASWTVPHQAPRIRARARKLSAQQGCRWACPA
eukprot:865058-Pelagomonas_calceolata.AAC.9